MSDRTDTACEYKDCERAAAVVRETVGGNYPVAYCVRHDPLLDPQVKGFFKTPEVGP